MADDDTPPSRDWLPRSGQSSGQPDEPAPSREGMPRMAAQPAPETFWSRVMNPTAKAQGATPPSTDQTERQYNPDVGYVGQNPVPMTPEQKVAAQAGAAGLIRGLTPGSDPEFEAKYGSNPLAKLGQATGTAIPLLMTEGVMNPANLYRLGAGVPEALKAYPFIQRMPWGDIGPVFQRAGDTIINRLALRTASNAAQGGEGALFTGGDVGTGAATGAAMGPLGWAMQAASRSPMLSMALAHTLDAHGVPRLLSHMVVAPMAWAGNNLLLRPLGAAASYLSGPAGAIEGYDPSNMPVATP